MAILYKLDVLAALKAKGYNTNRLRKERLLGEGTLQKLREGLPVNVSSLDKLCSLLGCQPGDLIEHKEDKT